MIIREFEQRDFARLKKLHDECGFDYELPDLGGPLIVVKRAVEDEGEIQAAGFLRLTTEAFLLMNAKWRTPGWRWMALNALHEAAKTAARAMGIEDANVWLPPEIERPFGRRLMAMGWSKDKPWATYTAQISRNGCGGIRQVALADTAQGSERSDGTAEQARKTVATVT